MDERRTGALLFSLNNKIDKVLAIQAVQGSEIKGIKEELGKLEVVTDDYSKTKAYVLGIVLATSTISGGLYFLWDVLLRSS